MRRVLLCIYVFVYLKTLCVCEISGYSVFRDKMCRSVYMLLIDYLAASFYAALVHVYQSTRRHIPDE